MAETAGNTALIDYNTGLPVNSGAYNFSQNGVTIASPTSTIGSQTQGNLTTQRSSQSSSSVNTTAGGLSALQSLIDQLSAHSNATGTDLDKVAPLLVPQSGGYGIVQRNAPDGTGRTVPIYGNITVYLDPLTGQTYSEADATKINAQRQQQRAQISQQAGTVEGTPQQQQQIAARTAEINRDVNLEGQYSHDAAMTDAQALIAKAIDTARRTALPGITAGADSAGTSKSSMRSLLTENTDIQGATQGAALGANLAVSYGGISANLANTLEALTRSDPNSPAAMLANLLIGTKGIVSSGTQSGTTGGSNQTTNNSNQQQSGQVTNSQQDRTPNNANIVPIPTVSAPASTIPSSAIFKSGNTSVAEDEADGQSVMNQTYQQLFG